jgi:hypothetical protein
VTQQLPDRERLDAAIPVSFAVKSESHFPDGLELGKEKHALVLLMLLR